MGTREGEGPGAPRDRVRGTMAPLSAAIAVASQTLPLYIGATSVSASALTALGVTHVLLTSCNGEKPDMPGTMVCVHLPVDDDMCTPLYEHLGRASEFISGALDVGGTVGILCADGASASPAIAAFFLMHRYAMNLSDALTTVRAAQPHARPNVGFWQQLIEAESWLHHGQELPSMSIQEYKWSYLQENFPDMAREDILARLEQGQSEVASLLHRFDYTPVG